MSTDNIKLFFDKIQDDACLQDRVAGISRESLKSSVEALAKLSEEAGTPFTGEEFLNFSRATGEISDAQLESVAGGTHPVRQTGAFNPGKIMQEIINKSKAQNAAEIADQIKTGFKSLDTSDLR